MTTSPTKPDAAVQPPLIQALRTPVGDLLQGRLSPPHDPSQIIRRADLPQSIAAAITTIIRRSRLWRAERADVAAELTAHFRDGLDAGHTPGDLLSAFGSLPIAAALIRRAKRRNRPAVWRAWVAATTAARWGFLLLLGLYSFFFVRYLLLEPRITRNYLAEINAPLAAIPEGDRAWPLYRDAYLALTPIMEQTPASLEFPAENAPMRLIDSFGAWDLPPETLARAGDYLRLNAGPLDTLRAAAARPSLGAQATTAFDLDMLRQSHAIAAVPTSDLSKYRTTHDENAPVVQIVAAEFAPVRLMARMLATDTRLAADAGDAHRAATNIVSMLAIADHFRQRGWLIGDVGAMAVQALALETTSHLLTDHPDLLSDAQLTVLAHDAAAIGAGEPIVRFDAQRLQFDDFLQRIYSDDGSGNGVITRQGLLEMELLTADFGAANPAPLHQNGFDLALGPLQSAVIADRASTRQVYHSFIDAIEARARQPLWERDNTGNLDARAERFFRDDLNRARYPVVALMVPAFENASVQAERILLRRDAMLTLIALELHRRRNGAYPATLADLSPTLLPIIPRDRLTGQPLCYILRRRPARHLQPRRGQRRRQRPTRRPDPSLLRRPLHPRRQPHQRPHEQPRLRTSLRRRLDPLAAGGRQTPVIRPGLSLGASPVASTHRPTPRRTLLHLAHPQPGLPGFFVRQANNPASPMHSPPPLPPRTDAPCPPPPPPPSRSRSNASCPTLPSSTSWGAPSGSSAGSTPTASSR